MDAGETATLTVANVTGLVPGLARAGTTLVVDPSHAAFQGLAAGEDGSVLIDVLANDSVGDTLTIVSVGAARHGGGHRGRPGPLHSGRRLCRRHQHRHGHRHGRERRAGGGVDILPGPLHRMRAINWNTYSPSPGARTY